jgi:transcriptional regulator with XRE-family HTH domain
MDQERESLGARLREQREARGLSIADLARVTKIPERSIALLEAGSFERLPAEVFVRGFLRSYCRAVGLDAEQAVRSYGELMRESRAPEPSLTQPAPLDDERAPDVGAALRPATTPAPEPRPQPVEDDRSAIGQLFSGVGRGTRRAPLTLAVIILVIIATLTLSLLLRRPSHVGDGLSLSSRVLERSS